MGYCEIEQGNKSLPSKYIKITQYTYLQYRCTE